MTGNPAKVADEAAVKAVRAGIRQGKSPVIGVSPSTKVTITTTDEDEAEFITRVLLANIGAGSNEDEFASFLHAFELYVTLYAIKAEHRPALIKALRRTQGSVLKMRD